MCELLILSVYTKQQKIHLAWYNINMTFEYPIFPDRSYRIDVDGEAHYITGENLIALVLDKLNES
jgi:hypothetical protein